MIFQNEKFSVSDEATMNGKKCIQLQAPDINDCDSYVYLTKKDVVVLKNFLACLEPNWDEDNDRT